MEKEYKENGWKANPWESFVCKVEGSTEPVKKMEKIQDALEFVPKHSRQELK